MQLYMSGSLYELQGVHRLVHVVDGWRNVAYNESEGIACE